MKKKKFIVLARNPKTQTNGLVTGKGHRKFGDKSAMWISDPAEAREIEHQYGMKGSRDVAVTTDQQYEWSVNNEGGDGRKMDNIHHYTFGPQTSKAAEEFWDRYQKKKQQKGKKTSKPRPRKTPERQKNGDRYDQKI